MNGYELQSWLRLIVVVLVLSLTRASPPGPGGWFGGANKGTENNKQWSSMLNVDPSKIIGLMIRHGGLLISESSKKELEVFAKVCHAEQVKLDVVKRKLEVKNFVVHLPAEGEALRIGRIHLQWDSYLKPCIEIEMDDVSILVDFFNVLLTKHNWNELKKNGFPPELPEVDPNTTTSTSSFVRIGSIDLSGTVVAVVKSRPMKKDLAIVKFDLDTFDPLNQQIKEQSLENLVNTGRRGCTTEELYTLITNFMNAMLRQALTEVAANAATDGGTKTLEKVNTAVTMTKGSISKYFTDAGEWTGEQVQGKLADRFQKWGVATHDQQSKQALSYLSKRLQKAGDTLLSNNEQLQEAYNAIPFFKRQQNQAETRDDSTDPGGG